MDVRLAGAPPTRLDVTRKTAKIREGGGGGRSAGELAWRSPDQILHGCLTRMPWIRAEGIADFADRNILGMKYEGRAIAVYKLEDGFFATSDLCPHQGALLSEGEVVEDYVECPGHFALFEIRTGKASGGLASTNLKTYRTEVAGTDVMIEID